MSNWPKVDRFLSEDEIVDVLFERLKDDQGAKQFVDDGPNLYHHTLGMAVRNEFWLWHPENPHTMKDYVPELRDGVDYNPRHADNTSGRILEKLHARIKAYLEQKVQNGQSELLLEPDVIRDQAAFLRLVLPRRYHDFFDRLCRTALSSFNAAHRDARQRRVAEWVVACFGSHCLSGLERVARLVEEAVELAQAEDIPIEQVEKIVRHVYGKPAGNCKQEAAGVGVTLLAYCAARGFSADEAEQAEVERVTSLPPEHFKERQNAKADAGIALRAREG